MALSALSSSVQQPSRLILDKLEKGFSNKEVIVRILHFWEARNPKKGGLLMGIELLLIDEKSTVIQAFIDANRVGCYETKLKADVIYKIKNFLVVDNKTKFRVSSHKYILKFTQQTRLDEVIMADQSIDRQQFRIRSFTGFKKIADRDEDLYDAIGKLLLINDEHLTNTESTNCVIKGKLEIHLQLKDGTVVRLFLWDHVAANFLKRIMKSVDKPVVLLATCVYSRTFRDGMLSLSSTSSTRIFFDNDVEPSTEFLTWLCEEGNNSVMVNNFNSKVTKSETVTIAELYGFLENNIPQKATFCCIATITEILPHYGWHYIACTKCACKLGRTESALVCNTCNNKKAVGIVRYRVEISVTDKDNVATFVVFDRDATKLTHMRAADVLEAHFQGNDDGAIENPSSIPQCLLDIVGRTFKFQVTITPYNFTAARQTSTVTHIQEEINDGGEALEENNNGGDEALEEDINGADEALQENNIGGNHGSEGLEEDINGGDKALQENNNGGNHGSDTEDGDMAGINHREKRIRHE